MKRFLLISLICVVSFAMVYAGPVNDQKTVTTNTVRSEEWYADNEFNVNLWGAYTFTQREYDPNYDLFDLSMSRPRDLGEYDKYLGGDHAWGGGIDFKYFFHRYFGIGLEGMALDANRYDFDITQTFIVTSGLVGGGILDKGVVGSHFTDGRVVGAVLGTFTLRYPISRFAPFAWVGGGGIFGGGEKRETLELLGGGPSGNILHQDFETHHFGARTELMGQFGGGVEVRITRHIGWTNDFSWNVINGADNNFGMVRTGLNFAF